MAEMKQFLDKAGLEVFWGIIKDNFATKNSAVSYDSLAVNTTSSAVGIRYKTIDDSKNGLLDIPVANDTQAGIITAETFKDIKAVAGDIQAAVNINEIKLDGNKVVPTIDKVVDIKLDYISEAGNSLIRLVDSNNADVYSEINVSDFVKAGLLNFAKLVVNPSGQPEGTYIWLSFKTTADPNNQASDIYINVTDLIDYYVGGEGISITANRYIEDGFYFSAGRLRGTPVAIGGTTWQPEIPIESRFLNTPMPESEKSPTVRRSTIRSWSTTLPA